MCGLPSLSSLHTGYYVHIQGGANDATSGTVHQQVHQGIKIILARNQDELCVFITSIFNVLARVALM